MTRPFEVLDDLPTDTPEWHEARRTSIGASEVAAILGLSPWQTPLDVYRSKMGVPHDIDPNRAYFGHALEPVIAGWVQTYHRDKVGYVGSGISARSMKWPWLSASPDRLVGKQFEPLELKTSSAYAKTAWEDGVPTGYQVQVQAQHAVLGTQHGWLAVLHGGNQPELHPVDRDDEFINDLLIPQAKRFWEEHVLAEVPPEPTTSAEAVSIWPGDDERPPLVADATLTQLVADYRAAKAAVKSYTAGLAEYALAIQKRMGDATELVDPMGTTLATWKPTKGARRLDSKALRADLPDVAATYTRLAAPGRQFRLPKEETDDE